MRSDSTLRASTSIATTAWPSSAKATASGRPTYPSPMIPIVIRPPVYAGRPSSRDGQMAGSHYHGAPLSTQADPPVTGSSDALPALPRARVVGIDLAVTDYGADDGLD